LRAYSLVQRNGREQTLSVHRLVQTVIRDAIEEQEAWITRVISAVSALFPAVSFGTWGRCARYLPQALVCEQWMAQQHLTLLEGASLLNRAGWYLKDRGKYAEAEPLYARALAIREQELGASHPYTATSLNNLAALYENQGKYAEAEPLYVRALAIYEQELGASHPDTATSLNNLAALYENQGKYAEAEPLYVRALTIFENILGRNHPSTRRVRANYAILLRMMGRDAEAVRLEVEP
jgi:tetratricopeptide (TPR) repeat protein